MIQCSISGHLIKGPQSTLSKAGHPVATAAVIVEVGKEPGEKTLWISLVASGPQADKLLGYRQGDRVQLAGKLSCTEYTPEKGATRDSWGLYVEQVLD